MLLAGHYSTRHKQTGNTWGSQQLCQCTCIPVGGHVSLGTSSSPAASHLCCPAACWGAVPDPACSRIHRHGTRIHRNDPHDLGTTHTWKSVHQCHVGTQGHTASSGSVSPCTAGPGCCCTSPESDATAMAPRRRGEWEGRDLSFTGWIDIQQKIFPYFTQMDPKPRVF